MGPGVEWTLKSFGTPQESPHGPPRAPELLHRAVCCGGCGCGCERCRSRNPKLTRRWRWPASYPSTGLITCAGGVKGARIPRAFCGEHGCVCGGGGGGGGRWSGVASGCWVRVGRWRVVKWRWRWLNSRSIWDGLRGEALRVGGYVGRVRVRVRVRWWLVHLDGG